MFHAKSCIKHIFQVKLSQLTCNISSNSSRFKTLLREPKGEGRKKGVFIIFVINIKLLQCCAKAILHKSIENQCNSAVTLHTTLLHKGFYIVFKTK